MFGEEGSWYDVMQVCMNGHMITSMARDKPASMMKRCRKCGEETITQCPACNTAIQGYQHIPNVYYGGPTSPPAHCHNCGAPYPWTTRKAETTAANEKATVKSRTKKIFVVHGHDEEMKQAIARILTQLGLDPIILHEQANQGRTLIEKFEQNASVQFAVVLLSPDDRGYPKSASAKDAKPRPRQNVILELGYFVGRLGRDRVFALNRGGDLELPSDINGVVYTAYDAAGHWKLELVKELRAAGYDVDANSLINSAVDAPTVTRGRDVRPRGRRGK